MNKLLTFGIWILLVLASVNAELGVNNITNPSFESAVGTEWNYYENSGSNWVDGGRVAVSPHTGTYSYKINTLSATPDWAQIQQNNTNLTGVEQIEVWVGDGNDGGSKLEVLINGTSLGNLSVTQGSMGKNTYNITEALRINGQTVALRVWTSVSSTNIYIDDVNATQINTAQLSLIEYCSQATKALTITFKNSTGNNVINGTISDLAFNLTSGSSTGNSNFTTTDNRLNYNFCSYPIGTYINATGTITYSLSPNFPQRTVYFDEELVSTSTTTKVLYLLDTDDGIYTTFQVLDEGNSPIQGVVVTGQELISGIYTSVVGGVTDSAGSITFWINPDSVHKFTFSKSGYTTTTYTVTPSQSAYTVNMGGATTTNETNYNIGILYNLLPTDSTLNSNTLYNFIFNLSSSHFNLSSWGFALKNSTGGTIATVTNTTGTAGGLINYTYNVSSDSRITMSYFWTTNDSAIGTITNDRNWYIKTTYMGNFSVLHLINDLKDTGSDEGFDDFGRAIVFIFVLIVIIGLVLGAVENYVEIEYTVLGIITALVWLGEYSEWIQPIGQKYFITVICGLILLAYAIQYNTK